METGNPKQVAALAVVAIGAMVFLVTRLGSRTPVAGAVAVRQADRPVEKPNAPLALLRDPFSHPRLAPFEAKRPVASKEKPPKKPFSIGGSLVAVNPLPSPAFAESPVEPIRLEEPVREKHAATKAPVAVSVSLEGVVGTDDPVAFLSVDGADSKPFRASDPIVRGVRLLRVGDGAVMLGGPKGKVSLDVGERRSL